VEDKKPEHAAEHQEPHHALHPAHPVHHAVHHAPKKTFAPIHLILAVLIGVVLIVNAVQILGVQKLLAGPASATPVKPSIKMTLITADCKECYDLAAVAKQLAASKEYAVDSLTLAMSDPHSKKLMNDYNVSRLPVIIVQGDVDKVQLQGFFKIGDALSLESPAPFYDVKSGSVGGLLSLEEVTADPALCPQCSNLSTLGDQLKQSGVALTSEKSFSASSEEGKRLINAYSITKLPAVVLSPAAKDYDFIAGQWDQVGDVAPDGSYVLRQVEPPYYDLTSGKVRGLLNLLELTDASCTTCYNASIHKEIFLSNFGAQFSTDRVVDVSSPEGKNLLAQYNLSLVPTIIVTGDPATYPALVAVWPSVGTVEKDGAYVFRKVNLLQGVNYKNLTNGKILSTAAPASGTA
jgi:hypothetical protein